MGRNLLSFADTEYDLPHGTVRFVRRDGDCGGANLALLDGLAPRARIVLLQALLAARRQGPGHPVRLELPTARPPARRLLCVLVVAPGRSGQALVLGWLEPAP